MANNSIGAYTLRVTPEEVQACAAELYGKVSATNIARNIRAARRK